MHTLHTQKGCKNFVIDDNMPGFYHEGILNMQKMQHDPAIYNLIDVCNSCKKELDCKRAIEVRVSFAKAYFQQFALA